MKKKLEVGMRVREIGSPKRKGRYGRVIFADMKGWRGESVVALLEAEDGSGEFVAAYRSDGTYCDGVGALEEYSLIEVSPYEDWEIDEPIWVRDFPDDRWVPRYFAGVSKAEEPLAWQEGRTSLTAQFMHMPKGAWLEAKRMSDFTPDPEDIANG
jgi:hypothetical protein